MRNHLLFVLWYIHNCHYEMNVFVTKFATSYNEWFLHTYQDWQSWLVEKLDGQPTLQPGPEGHFTHEAGSPWPLPFKHSHWWKMRSQSKFTSHYAWGTNIVCEYKMDVKSTWIPKWHQMDNVFIVTWTMFKNHLLEVGLTQNLGETMALRMLATVNLFYFIICEDPHK